MKKGRNLILTEKNEKHAIKALKNSEMLVFTKGPYKKILNYIKMVGHY